MTCAGLLALCDSIRSFVDDDFEVWVCGGRVKEARPVTSIKLSHSNILLTCPASRDPDGVAVCKLKELLVCLREKIATLDTITLSHSMCCVCCVDDFGMTHYIDFANERPLSFFNDEYMIFMLGRELKILD